MKPIVRVLALPKGKAEDTEGRSIGDDWLVATLGCDEEGTDFYLTTDHIRASELYIFEEELLAPRKLAYFLTNAINLYFAQKEQMDLFKKEQKKNVRKP